jgi:DNA repair exonuclease SbcCD ATPase subunit
MKQLLLICSVLAIAFTGRPTSLFAQTTTTPVELDAKTQKKVDKAKVDLAKDQQKLHQTEAKLEKDKAKHDKDIEKGKLSPKAIEKGEKRHAKYLKQIEKLKEAIMNNETYLHPFEMPA